MVKVIKVSLMKYMCCLLVLLSLYGCGKENATVEKTYDPTIENKQQEFSDSVENNIYEIQPEEEEEETSYDTDVSQNSYKKLKLEQSIDQIKDIIQESY